jgi:hypothetical protein
MILDAKLKFNTNQAVTVTADSTDILDLGAKGDALGEENMYLVIQTNAVAITAAGAATVDFELQTATDAAFTTPITLFKSGPIGKAALTANVEPVKTQLPIGVNRFLKVVYTVATGPLTAGSFDAFLTPNVDVGR